MEEELNELYKDVQKDFADFYRIINEGDEEQFTATLTPTEGRLDLLVNFYEKGLFPPAAFHSEGHQDGMGVCLYLALMKRLLGKRFTFALMDDVVMSVDVGHRYQFCKLLKEQFPDTQFVITTHDRLWAEQMRHVVSSKTSLVFQNWTVDTGPIVESDEEIWVDIDAALTKGKVQVAAAMLRHHLEYAVPHLAENLGARAVFRSDGAYELGDLMPSPEPHGGAAGEGGKRGAFVERHCGTPGRFRSQEQTCRVQRREECRGMGGEQGRPLQRLGQFR